MRRANVWILCCVVIGACLFMVRPVQAQQIVNMHDADIRAFIQDVARVTGRTIIVDPQVQGKVTVISDSPVSDGEYFELFLATLRANGFIASPTADGALRIDVKNVAPRVPLAPSKDNGFVTEVFHLSNVDAASVVETLRPFVGTVGQVSASRTQNAVVVADYSDNIRRIRAIVRKVDKNEDITRTITLQNAGAREVMTALHDLEKSQDSKTKSTVALSPLDASNSILMRGPPKRLKELVDIAQDLDRRAAEGSFVRVIFLQHADADTILPVLQQLTGQAVTLPTTSQLKASASLFGDQSPSVTGDQTSSGGSSGASASSQATPAPASGAAASHGKIAAAPAGATVIGRGQVTISRFRGANAIVIAGPRDAQRQLGEVVRQLDKRRQQVLVEAVIAEISDSAASNLGVQFVLAGTRGSEVPFVSSTYGTAAPNILAITGAVAVQRGAFPDPDGSIMRNAVNALTSVTGITGGGAFDLGGGNLLGVIVNALDSDTKSNILSTPSILTLDNQPAYILVGQEVPVTTGESLSQNFNNTFRTVKRQNVGVMLEVRPQINGGGSIKMFLRQEVSSIVSDAASLAAGTVILNKRELATTVTVDNGEMVILGGLIDGKNVKSVDKIPFLGDLPGIGALFTSKKNQQAKTNLMIFLRPIVLDGKEDARRLTAQRYGYLRQLEVGPEGQDPSYLDQLVRDYFNATPPGAVPGQQIPLPQQVPTSGPASQEKSR